MYTGGVLVKLCGDTGIWSVSYNAAPLCSPSSVALQVLPATTFDLWLYVQLLWFSILSRNSLVSSHFLFAVLLHPTIWSQWFCVQPVNLTPGSHCILVCPSWLWTVAWVTSLLWFPQSSSARGVCTLPWMLVATVRGHPEWLWESDTEERTYRKTVANIKLDEGFN